MDIGVLGTGYVGLVAGACFAEMGNHAVCMDIDKGKIERLKKGECPIYEPGLEEIIKRNMKSGRLSFTTNLGEAVKGKSCVFIAVGTPEKDDGRADLKYVMQVAENIAPLLEEDAVVVNKSTVPVGTGKIIKGIIAKGTGKKFHIASNPEFLREGCAVKDFMEPDRVVVGTETAHARNVMDELYKPLDSEVLFTGIESAEIIKYASNAFLASKISFINEVSRLCEKTGANVRDVAKGMGLDSRIGKAFLNAGCGWGGSCFPKDVKALIQIGNDYGIDFQLARASEKVNDGQKLLPALKAEKRLQSLKGKRIALFGLAFKPETDDMRNATSIEVAEYLLSKGAKVVGYDPVAEENAKMAIKGIEFSDIPENAAKGADAILLLTEWKEFWELDYGKLLSSMKGKVLIDGRNFLEKEKMLKTGFEYEGIGI